jgi:CRISPR-associated protein Csb2
MARVILITVRLHEGRYHGVGDDPPSPARLFQALVAGIGLGGPLSSQQSEALEWLEGCDPPVIAAPLMTRGQSMTNYVPNNDLDAVGGDPRRVAQIRGAKIITPRVFDPELPFLYAWAFDEDEGNRQARSICSIADQLYQLGRGVDLAWAWGEVLDIEEVDGRILGYPGLVYKPSRGGRGRTLACPRTGSLKSLKARHAANTQRFSAHGSGKDAKQLFSKPPKPYFRQVVYDSSPVRRVYDLHEGTSTSAFAVWPLGRAVELVVELRDAAAKRLRSALPDRDAEIERVLVGRKADGSDAGPTSERVWIMPMPSIGFHHADRGIRRVLVEVPGVCPLRTDDVYWAFSGLELPSPSIGATQPSIVTAATDASMCAHYGIEADPVHWMWRTVTPVALPGWASRRRIDPAGASLDAKNGTERRSEQARAAGAVLQALRFANVHTRVDVIRVQREPFEERGERVEAFAAGTRFAKERLWHVEIAFTEAIAGPLVIGDGRFLGLGVMAPVRASE